MSVARLEIISKIIHCIQVETIGDAYCVAGGLHKESETHAVQIALMALKMMELSDDVMTPTGEQIQVRVKYCFVLIIQLDDVTSNNAQEFSCNSCLKGFHFKINDLSSTERLLSLK